MEYYSEIREIAQSRLILRIIYGAMQEGIFDAAITFSAAERTGNVILLRNAKEIYDYIYTRNSTQPVTLTLHDHSHKTVINDIYDNFVNGLLRDKILQKNVEALENGNWLNFHDEVLDSLEHEMLSVSAHMNFQQSLKRERQYYCNIWNWIFSDKSASWLKEYNHDLDSFFLQLASFLGHPTHPCSKVRLLLDPKIPGKRHAVKNNEARAYFPEFAPNVQLPLYAVKATRLTVSTIDDLHKDYRGYIKRSFPEAYKAWEKVLEAKVGKHALTLYLPIPVHPLQIPEIAHRFSSELQNSTLLSLSGAYITQRPTISSRTLTPVNDTAPQIKTTLNMQLTSVVRTIAPARAYNAPIYSDILRTIVQRDVALSEALRPLPEQVALYYGTNDDEQSQEYQDSYHLGALFKQNPAQLVAANEIRIPLAALLGESPFSRNPVIIDMMQAGSVKTQQEAKAYFRSYADTVVRSDIGILSRYGISLEGHQQNDDMVFDKHSVQPKAIIYRDINGGIEVCRPLLEMNGYDVSGKIHRVKKGIYEDITVPLEQTTHTTFYSHLFPLVSIISTFYAIPQTDLYDCITESVKNTLEYAIEHHWPAVVGKIPHEEQKMAKTLYEYIIQKLREALLLSDMKIKCLLCMKLENTQKEQFISVINPLAKS